MIRKIFVYGGAPLAALFAIAVGVPALAYQSPTPTNSTATVSPASGVAGATITFTATFKDNNGAPVVGAAVTFSQQAGPANCTVTFSPTTGTTDANGQVSTQVTLPQGCPGSYVLAASTAGATVTATVTESGGFAATSAEQPNGSRLPTVTLVILLGIGLIALAGAGLRRRTR
jgi:Bacterial Ig-like domain (group 1)